MIGEKVQCCVIEVDRERHRLDPERTRCQHRNRDMVREKILDTLKEGDVRTPPRYQPG
jgi:ribosomal protein S1